jgi:hypothetical protein
MDQPDNSPKKSEIAKEKLRDDKGHFIHSSPSTQSTPTEKPTPEYPTIPGVAVHKTNDDNTLVDVHLNNPLHRITEILEDIKKQKAFSFTLKGSLGIMGVVLAFSVFGFFGTAHILCDKGIQTKSGTIKVIHPDLSEDQVPGLYGEISSAVKYYSNLVTGTQTDVKRDTVRYILYTADHEAIHLVPSSGITLQPVQNSSFFATGNYDSCSEEMRIEKAKNIEPIGT